MQFYKKKTHIVKKSPGKPEFHLKKVYAQYFARKLRNTPAGEWLECTLNEKKFEKRKMFLKNIKKKFFMHLVKCRKGKAGW